MDSLSMMTVMVKGVAQKGEVQRLKVCVCALQKQSHCNSEIEIYYSFFIIVQCQRRHLLSNALLLHILAIVHSPQMPQLSVHMNTDNLNLDLRQKLKESNPNIGPG